MNQEITHAALIRDIFKKNLQNKKMSKDSIEEYFRTLQEAHLYTKGLISYFNRLQESSKVVREDVESFAAEFSDQINPKTYKVFLEQFSAYLDREIFDNLDKNIEALPRMQEWKNAFEEENTDAMKEFLSINKQTIINACERLEKSLPQQQKLLIKYYESFDQALTLAQQEQPEYLNNIALNKEQKILHDVDYANDVADEQYLKPLEKIESLRMLLTTNKELPQELTHFLKRMQREAYKPVRASLNRFALLASALIPQVTTVFNKDGVLTPEDNINTGIVQVIGLALGYGLQKAFPSLKESLSEHLSPITKSAIIGGIMGTAAAFTPVKFVKAPPLKEASNHHIHYQPPLKNNNDQSLILTANMLQFSK